jgi:flagellum-specific peptidoglycan hydrolase FlgJ
MRLRQEKITGSTESDLNDTIAIGSVSQETFEAYILQNHKLDITPEELATRLDDSFVRAIEVQADALKDGGEEAKRRADVVALLAAYEGMGNKKVFNKHGDYAAKSYVSVNDFKLSQIEAVLANIGPAEDAVIIENAVRNICSVYQIDFSVSRVDAMKAAVKENRHIQHAVATTAFVAAAGVASVVVATPAAADDTLIVNTNPTNPSPHVNEIANGDVVKIVAKTISKPQQDLVPSVVIEDVVTVKPSPAKVISAPKSKEASVQTTDSDDVVRISKRTIDGPKKIIGKAPVDHTEKSDDPVITVKPIPVVPAPAPENIPKPETKNESKHTPYQLNDEQNGLIDSLTLRASQKDFLKQVTAGAIGLQQRGAKVNPEVVIAQAVLESGWGGSELTKVANNYFGMKAGTTWKGKTVIMPTQEFINGSWVTVDAKWQAFDSAEDCFAEYEKFISERPHFADALQHSNNPEEYVKALVDGDLKYATDPSYVSKIMATVKANHLSEVIGIANKVQADKKVAEDAAASEAKRSADEKAALPANSVDAIKMFNQCDPRWGNIQSPNGQRACNIACGPTNVAMIASILKPELGITPKETIEYANDHRLWFTPRGGALDSGGTTFDAVVKLAANWGIEGNQMADAKLNDFNTYKKILAEGGFIIAAGSGPAPFVQPNVGAHFVTIVGTTDDGKFLVADPYPKTTDKNVVAWDADQMMRSIFGAVVLYEKDKVNASSSLISVLPSSNNLTISEQELVKQDKSLLVNTQDVAQEIRTDIIGDHSLTDDQKRRLAAIKQVAELKKRMAAAAEQKSQHVADETYLKVR